MMPVPVAPSAMYQGRNPRDIYNMLCFLKAWKQSGEPLPWATEELVDSIIDRLELLYEVY
jgi:hypothetical protein